MFASDPTPAPRESFLRALGLIAIPILIGESCVTVREWLKREHKAAIRKRGDGPRSDVSQ